MSTHKLRADLTCPVCSHTLDAASNITGGDEAPKPEDLTVCINCGFVMKFIDQGGDIGVVVAGEDELGLFAEESPEQYGALMKTVSHIANRQVC